MGTLAFLPDITVRPSFRDANRSDARLALAPVKGDRMLDQYVAHMRRRHLSPATIQLRTHYLRHFSDMHDLTTATHEDMEAFIWAKPGWSSNTRAAATASLKTFYRWAARENLIIPNPARDLPHIVGRRRTARIASEDQISRAVTCDDLADKAMVMLGAECGLRVAEIAALHRTCRDADWLTIIGKGGKERTLNLSPELEQILTRIEQSSMRHGWYFPGLHPTQHIHPSTVWRHIRTVLESNPHSLRRRAGTVVYRRSGNDIRLAQEFLGHSSTVTTSIYLDVGADDLRRASALTRLAA